MTDLREIAEAATPQQVASHYLREQILSGAFPVGTRIKTEEIANSLGVSRMPVRDALQQLHSEGLVVIRPNRGAIVTKLTADEIQEMFDIRAALEALAARHACNNLTSENFAQLESVLEQMHDACTDIQRWIDLHEQFHEIFAQAANKRRLMAHIRNARRAVLPYVRMYVTAYKHMEMPRAEHEMLIVIARRGNPALLEEAMRDHILTASQGVAQFLRDTASEAAD